MPEENEGEDEDPTEEITIDDLQEVYEIPLHRNESGQFEYVLPEELARFHDFPSSVSYWISTMWADEGRDTTISYDVRPTNSNLSNARSVIDHSGGKATVRIPKAFVVDRKLNERLDGGSKPTLFVFTPEEKHLQLVLDEPFPELTELNPVDEIISKKGFSPKRDGPNREYLGYRFVLPHRYNRLYGMNAEEGGFGRWSLAIYQNRPVLVLNILEGGNEEEFRNDTLVTRWQAYEAGDVKEGETYTIPQVQMMVPRVLVKALGWEKQEIQLYPEEGRIIIVPDQGTTNSALTTQSRVSESNSSEA